MNIAQATIIDSINFLLFILIAFILISKKMKGIKRLYFYLYILFTYSSYNILIKPIHDYNIVIPRTALFHMKTVSIFSIADVIVIGLAFYFLVDFIRNGKIRIYKNKLLKLTYIAITKDLIIFVIGTIGFILYTFYSSSEMYSFADQFRNARGFFYTFVFIYFLFWFLRNSLDVKFIDMLSIYITLDIINLLSGFISTLINSKYVWQRYFLNVVILDQDDLYIVIFYSTIFFTSLYLGKKINFGKLSNLGIYISTLLILLTFSKTFYVYLFLLLSFVVIILIRLRKKFLFKFMILFTAIGTFLPLAIFFVQSDAIVTRFAQVNDYYSYISTLKNSEMFYFLGIGNGGYYRESDPELYDEGSKRKIDTEKYSGLRKSIQTPVISITKLSGFLGLFIFLIFGLYSIMYSVKSTKGSVFEISASFFILYNVFFHNILLYAEPARLIQIYKIVLLFILYKKDYLLNPAFRSSYSQ